MLKPPRPATPGRRPSASCCRSTLATRSAGATPKTMPVRIEMAKVKASTPPSMPICVQARNVAGIDGADHVQAPRGDHQAGGAAQHAQQNALGEQLPHQSPPSGAERRADGHFLLRGRWRARAAGWRHWRRRSAAPAPPSRAAPAPRAARRPPPVPAAAPR